MNFLSFVSENPEFLWIFTVFYDLSITVVLFKLFGLRGLYIAVTLGIMLANLQGGKVSDLNLFGQTFTVSMGAIMYSGIYFATDVLNEKYGRQEANRAVMLGFFANIAVMITLVLSVQFKPSEITGSALEVHNAISTLAYYSPAFVIGSLTAYLVSQTFDVWFFNKIKSITGESKLWLRNNLSTITSQLIDTLIYQFTWVFATGMDWSTALMLALTKYVFKVLIAAIDTIFIYWVKKW